MGAGLAVGIPIALIPIPGSRILAWGLGTVASGKAAYEMSTYQIMQTYLEAKDEEKMAISGQGLTLEEENNLKQGFNKLASQYGLWEAIPEALSNLAFASILTAPLTKIVGKSIAGKIVEKLVGMYGEELLTETITQIGQKGVMGEAGLLGGGKIDWTSPTEWKEAFKEVAPQTFLLTTIMAGTGTLAINTNKVVKSLNNEVKDSVIKEKLMEKIKDKTSIQEAVTEKPAAVEAPTPPVIGKGKVSKIAAKLEAKFIEQGIIKEFGDVAEFTPMVIKEQVKMFTDLINNNIDEARSMVRGEKPILQGGNPVFLIKAMDAYVKKTGNGEIALELVDSPLITGTSIAAQTLRGAREIDPESPVKAIADVNKLLEERASKRYPKQILAKAKENVTNSIKNEIKKTNTSQSWQQFILSIQC